jgi:hypothetical protein
MMTAACHVHSDWSYDGKWPLGDLAEAFSRRGYRTLMMTEHDRGFTEARRQEHRSACAAASSERIFILAGLEYSDASNSVHVLVWGPVPFLGERLPTAELLKMVDASGGVAVLAHPSRRQAWKLWDPAWAARLLGIEAWNRKTDGWAPSPHAPALLEGTKCLPFVGMDFHDRNQFFPLAMELELAGEPTEDSVLDCLRSQRARAIAFGRPLERFSRRGAASRCLSAMEVLRRSAAWPVRLLRRNLKQLTNAQIRESGRSGPASETRDG